MLAAFLYLQACLIKNVVRLRLRRLRQPKYLVAALAGGAYFYFALIRPMLFNPRRPLGGARSGALSSALGEWAGLFELGGAWILAGVCLFAWVIPSRRAALDFTEAEVGFLFPAPIRRRTLLHYKLMRWQLGFVFGSVILSLFSGRLLRAGAWMPLIGGWLLLLVIQLHFVGASFTLTRLLDSGVGHARRRMWILGFTVVALGVGVGWELWREWPPFLASLDSADGSDFVREFVDGLRRVSNGGLLGLLTTPFRWMIRLVTTQEPGVFWRTLPAVLVLAYLHYLWVLRSEVAFEEASMEAARRKLKVLETTRALAKGVPLARPRKGAFQLPLPVWGPSWLALTWKNLVPLTGSVSKGFLIVTALVGLPLLLGAWAISRAPGWTDALGLMLSMGLVFSVFIGPQAMRFDLRQDLAVAEQLKVLPLPGWQIVLAEILAPWLVLAVVQWAIILLIAMVMGQLPGGGPLPWTMRVAGAVAASLLMPALSAIGFVLQNAGVLYFPAWLLMNPVGRHGGFEAIGQQMILLVGQVVTLLLAVLPAAFAAALVAIATGWMAGPVAALVPTALVATVVLLLEAGLAVRWMGQVLERLDVSGEGTGSS